MKKLIYIFLVVFLSSCRVTYSSKAYIAENIYKSANVTVLKLRNLSYTEGLDLFVDSAKCKQSDTILVKSKVKRFLCFGSERVYIFR
jgi:hypothetical protein